MTTNNVSPMRADIAEMLDRIRDVSSRTNAFHNQQPTALAKLEPASEGPFQTIMSAVKNAMGHVSSVQSQSDQLKESYLMGDQNVSLSQVVVAAQKSKLALEGLMTVRNKILESYKEIMNMQV